MLYTMRNAQTGHTLGSPYKHMRRELVSKTDRQKTIALFGRTQGWSPAEIEQQALAPIEESSIRGTAHAGPHSIMCYQIPGKLTEDGKPIVRGRDIDKNYYTFAGAIYPQPNKTSSVGKRVTSQRAKSRSGK